jgi:beta-glucosidase
MFWAGEEGGTAIADVLFGDYNPAGRLPYTVYRSVQDIPPMNEYDISKGFTYMYFGGEPDYVFGHGLSYTRFTYSNLKVSGDVAGGRLDLHVDVRNDGKRAGDEVAQVYVRNVEARADRPKKRLVAFERIHLMPGETKAVKFAVAADQLAFWDETKKAWVLDAAAFEVMVGGSSVDIRLREQFRVGAR